jgi:hypothetical protein
MNSDPKYTADVVRQAIHNKGIEEVKKIVYGTPAHEVVAITNFINSRMAADQIINQLKQL